MHHIDSTLTPPPPSSSPGFIESMDISPLPHKAPFVVESQVEFTPVETIAVDACLDMDMTQDTPSELMNQAGIQE